MGWSGIFAYEKAAAAFPSSTLMLIATGGVLDTFGVVFIRGSGCVSRTQYGTALSSWVLAVISRRCWGSKSFRSPTKPHSTDFYRRVAGMIIQKMSRASSGKGRCSAFASSHGASKRRAPRRSPRSPASPSCGSTRRPRSAMSSGSRRPGADLRVRKERQLYCGGPRNKKRPASAGRFFSYRTKPAAVNWPARG